MISPDDEQPKRGRTWREAPLRPAGCHDPGMGRTARIVIGLSNETLRSLDRVTRRLGTSRSTAVASAIDDWVRLYELDPDDKRYAEAYLRMPEGTTELATIAAGATATRR